MAPTAGYNRPYTKLTCPSPTTGARGPRFHGIGDEEPPYTTRATTQTEPNGKAQVVPFHTHTPTCQPERNDKPTVSYRRQWNPCHMDFGLVPASH